MNLPTAEEVGSALAHLGNWCVLHVQEVCYPYTKVPASVMLGIGYRETALKNICGGATWDGSKWVQAFTDRGYLQISDQVENEAEWLAKVPGCKNGEWVPDGTHKAIDPMHVPRFSDATAYVYKTLISDMDFGHAHGVPTNELLRFAVAAHNAGPTGALEGFQAGNVDAHTAHGDYSAYVMAVRDPIHAWIATHPNWQYRPPTQAHEKV